jgi:hypothetical protein
MTIEQDLLSVSRRRRVAFEFGVDNRIMPVLRVQHFSLRAIFFEQGPQERGTTPTVLGIVWPRRYGLERDKLL